MNNSARIYLDTLKGVKQFGEDNVLTPANAEATTAFTVVGSSITLVETLDASRLNGSSTSSGASQEKQLLRKILRTQVSDLSRVSKTLDKAVYPDVAAQLKMGRGLNSYADVITLANNAIVVITPIKAVFIARGAPATVIEDLQAGIDALEAAIARRLGGRGKRIGSNADLQVAIRAGMAQVRILDGILCLLLKSTPGLLAEWKAAKRVQRRLPAEQPAPAPGSGSAPASGT